jgi:hypothetical protein
MVNFYSPPSVHNPIWGSMHPHCYDVSQKPFVPQHDAKIVLPQTNLKMANERRTVRFAIDKHNAVLEQVITIDLPPAYCAVDLYWSTEDMGYFRFKAKVQAKRLRAAHPMTVERLDAVYLRCGGFSLEAAELRHDMETMFDWVTADCRGLERGVSTLFSKETRSVVRAIVNHYHYLLLTRPEPGLDEALACFSTRLTGNGREFAFMMGINDAENAQASDEPLT